MVFLLRVTYYSAQSLKHLTLIFFFALLLCTFTQTPCRFEGNQRDLLDAKSFIFLGRLMYRRVRTQLQSSEASLFEISSLTRLG